MQEKVPRRGTEPPANGRESANRKGVFQPQSTLQMRPRPRHHPHCNLMSPNDPTKLLPDSWTSLMQENCEPTLDVCPPNTRDQYPPHLVTAAVLQVLPAPACPSVSLTSVRSDHTCRGRENSGEHTAWSPPPRAQPSGPAPPLDGTRAWRLSAGLGELRRAGPASRRDTVSPRHPYVAGDKPTRHTSRVSWAL